MPGKTPNSGRQAYFKQHPELADAGPVDPGWQRTLQWRAKCRNSGQIVPPDPDTRQSLQTAPLKHRRPSHHGIVAHLNGDPTDSSPGNLFLCATRAEFVRARNTIFKLLPALCAAGLVTTIGTADPQSGCPSYCYVLADPQAPGTELPQGVAP